MIAKTPESARYKILTRLIERKGQDKKLVDLRVQLEQSNQIIKRMGRMVADEQTQVEENLKTQQKH